METTGNALKSQEIVSQVPQTIASHEEYKKAVEILRDVRALQKEIRENFKDAIDHAHKTHKKILEQRNAHLKPLDEAEQRLIFLSGHWLAIEKERAEKLRLEAEEKARKENEVLQSWGIDDVLVTPETVKVQSEGLHTREVWLCEIVNISEVPREWMTPDMDRISKHARENKENAQIPGVRFWSEKTIVVR